VIITTEDLRQFKQYLVDQLQSIYEVTNAKEKALRAETLPVMDWTNDQIEQQHQGLLNDIALLTDAIEGKVVFTEKKLMNTQRPLRFPNGSPKWTLPTPSTIGYCLSKASSAKTKQHPSKGSD
jgi:hypothetical protein